MLIAGLAQLTAGKNAAAGLTSAFRHLLKQ
jgi:hypothetical protein